ncbi:SGNH/GDSL hydrolase family protein [Pedobacter punctiformis]|uniref:SGNH/GDSL hydrolase family protein n=1 Tax=Pedobacter punctiformis TaxID=3004097 RepID=A0ABT4LAH5_9SPHI|nr:SGNH/GDSL hydrolase family protein [Pedobacter sp. HCMS5-2]MCZ4244697.1 SGNH/GDSL hydrolase family protein [Pedobacter sp. HCMS5-2]
MAESLSIHFIGDSHSSFFSGVNIIQPEYPFSSNDTISYFRTYRLGPVLAYSLSSNNTTCRGREKLFQVIDTLPKKSNIVLCFGEIDCRYHLLFQSAKKKIPLEDVINDCLNNYFKTVLEIRKLSYNVGIWGAIPTSYFNNNPLFPSYGTHLDRNRCTKIFNTKLESLCEQHGIIFFSIFKSMVKKNLYTLPYVFFDGIHLSQVVMPIALNEIRKQFPTIQLSNNWFMKYIFAVKKKQIRMAYQSIKQKIKSAGKKIGLNIIYYKITNVLFPSVQIPEYSEKRAIILSYQRIFKTKIFIETGTFMGDTVEVLINDFDNLYSIELSEELASKAIKRFESIQKIKIIQGDSGIQIGKLIKDINQPVLFWLDGHYSGEFMYNDEFIKTAKGTLNTPIEKELQLILASEQAHIILIDDARLFTGEMDYPTIKQIKDIVRKNSRFNHKLSVSRDIIRITPKIN